MNENRKTDCQTLLQANGLTVGYRDLTFVGNVDMQVRPRERIGIAGDSGSGKSTLLKTLSTLVAPLGGEVLFRGKNASELPFNQLRAQVLYVSANNHQRAENIWEYWLRPFAYRSHSTKVYSKDQAARFLRAVDLPVELLDKNATSLSSGQWQLVRIGQALSLKPSVLLLDEPMANLDSHRVGLLEKELIQYCHDLDAAILFTSHNREQMQHFATRTVSIRQQTLQWEVSDAPA